MPSTNPVSMTHSTRPISDLSPAEPSYRESAAISDSMGPAESQPVWTPERPVLTSPNDLPPPNNNPYSVFRFLEATDESRNLGNQIMNTLGLRLQNVKHKIKEISAENIQKLKAAAQRASESSFWSTLKKIATCLLSAISIVFGISLVASGGGALIGGAMIASGILSLANFAMGETGAWDWISKQLAGDNEERQKQLAWILPCAVGVVAGGIGLVGSIQGVASGAIQFAEKAVYVAQTALTIFSAATTFGSGVASARLIWAQSDVTKIQADLTVEQTNFDSLIEEVKISMNDFKAAKAKTKKTIETLSQSNIQLVRQV